MAAHSFADAAGPLPVGLFERSLVELCATEIGLAQIGAIEGAAP